MSRPEPDAEPDDAEERWRQLSTAACVHEYRPLTIDQLGNSRWWKCGNCRTITRCGCSTSAAAGVSCCCCAVATRPSLTGVGVDDDAGALRTLHFDVSDARERDVFESAFRAGPERWLLAHPDTLGAEEIRAWLDERRREYVDGHRGQLGFAWLVLARAGG